MFLKKKDQNDGLFVAYKTRGGVHSEKIFFFLSLDFGKTRRKRNTETDRKRGEGNGHECIPATVSGIANSP